MVWRLFVVPEYGLLSPFFASMGISVLTSPAPATGYGHSSLPTCTRTLFLIVPRCGRPCPSPRCLFLAALQTVPNEVLESASIDGATVRTVFSPHHLCRSSCPRWPSLINLILGGINGVGMVFSLTGGGPGTATEVLSYLLYSIGFAGWILGLAASLSVLMSIVNLVLVLSTLQPVRTKRRCIVNVLRQTEADL